ncbi:unnamed protein product [Sphagnum troendelagicum]|uniref:Uncharacterized protein n=1 Tax=Sphagnum troendelagicum TaxID=128251 RepID=A0ABP0TA64_9BRYO
MFLSPRRKLHKSVNYSSWCESSSAETQTSSLAGHENSRRMEALQAMLSCFVQGVVTKGLMERELFGGDLLPMDGHFV